MGKVVAKVGMIVGAVALVATGVGAIAMPGIAGFTSILGLKASTLLLAGAGMQALGTALTPKPKLSSSSTDRLNASLVTDTPRKIAFGRTALNTDLRYQEWWGRDQEYCSQVFVLASHWCESVDEIYLDDKLAWTAAGGVTGEFAGYLVVGVHAQAGPGSVFNAAWSRRWGANATFSGCATLYLQFKVTGNGKKGTSPFTGQITSRVTVVGKGARLPDPRFDSTVGGSGNVRVADQTTWAWAPAGYEAGRNPALALLFYLLGWRIQNPSTGEWKLAIGCGVPADRIDLGSFMTAANMCDEPVLRADGTYEPRYRCDGTFSAADEPTEVFATLEACMNAKLRDSAGRFTLQVLHNDLATPVVDFTDDDVLGDFTWTAGNDLNDRKNVVRGRLTDPSSLYQLIDFPAVRIPSLDGIERIDSVDFALVQSASQAQRLAKQRLQRTQYQGAFAAEFNARGWAVKDGDPVTLTFSALGFNKKKFRVAEGLVDPTGVVPLVLVEEHEAIYAWDRGESASVQAAEPNRFDPLLLPVLQAIDEAGTTADWPAITGEGKPDDYATNSGDPNSPFGPGTVNDALNRLTRLTGAIEVLADRPFTTEEDIATAMERVAELRGVIEALAGTNAPGQLGAGAQQLLDGIRKQKVAQLAEQLLGEARKQRFDALTHIDGLPAGTVVKRVDRQRQEGDTLLAESISVVSASVEQVDQRLSGEVLRIDQAIVSGGEASAAALQSVRAELEGEIGSVDGRITGEVLRLDKAVADGTQAQASALASTRAEIEGSIAGVESNVAAEVTRLENALATGDQASADALQTVKAELQGGIAGVDGRISAESTRIDQAIASGDEAQAAALQLVKAGLEGGIAGVDGRVTAESARLDLAVATGDQAQADALQTVKAQLEGGIAGVDGRISAETARLDNAIASESGAQALALQSVKAELQGGIAGVDGRVSSEAIRLEQAIANGDQTQAQSINEVRAQIGDLSATVSQQAAALVDVNGKVLAYLQLEVDAGSGRAVVRLAADGRDGSTIDFAANRLRFANPVDGQMITAMHVVGGNVEIVNDLLLGSGRIISRSATHMLVQGTGFGNANQFIEWFGPIKSSLSECTEAQAIRYTKVDGAAYSLGIVAEGQLRAQKTSFDVGLSSVAIGPNVTNGKTRYYVASLSYERLGTRWSNHEDLGPITGTFIVERLNPDGSWAQLGSGMLGNYEYWSNNDGFGGEFEPSPFRKVASGTVQITDASGGTEPIQLRARVTALSAPSVSGTNYQTDQVSQVLQLVTYEP